MTRTGHPQMAGFVSEYVAGFVGIRSNAAIAY